MTAPPHAGEVDEILLALAHAARAAGLGVTHDRAATFLEAASVVGAGDLEHVRRAGRATLCAGPEDLLRFEQVYAEWFAGRDDLRTEHEPFSTSPVVRRRTLGVD